MSHEGETFIQISQIPLGWEVVCIAVHLAEAKRIHRDQGGRQSIIAIDQRGLFSVWIKRTKFWPLN
jgi:hypothetical protein